MPEENQDDKLEEEMLRMMQEESEGESTDAEGESDAGGEDDAEAEMLRAMQGETGSEGDESGDEDAMEAEMLRAMMDETDTAEGPARSAMKQGLEMLTGSESHPVGIERLLDVKLSVSIELGRTEEPISVVLEWTEGSLIELSKVSGDAVDVIINGKLYAKGEVVTIAENFGVRITELMPATRR